MKIRIKNGKVILRDRVEENLNVYYENGFITDVTDQELPCGEEIDAKGKYLLTEAQRDTIKAHILGDHLCSLQWISWKKFGKVSFTEGPDGKLYCKGGQTGEGGDYLKIDGYVTIISPLHITITGAITTKVSHINGGKPVVRKGKYNFTIAGARRYWRMREMQNPAPDGPTDYVDIYF